MEVKVAVVIDELDLGLAMLALEGDLVLDFIAFDYLSCSSGMDCSFSFGLSFAFVDGLAGVGSDLKYSF